MLSGWLTVWASADFMPHFYLPRSFALVTGIGHWLGSLGACSSRVLVQQGLN